MTTALPDARASEGRYPAVGLKDALDPGWAVGRLATMVDREGGWRIDRCQPGKVLILADGGCAVRYALRLSRGGRPHTTTLGARLFPSPAAAATSARALVPLGAAATGRPELRPFRTPAGQLQDSAMTAYAFPVDPELPTLVGATDPLSMAPALSEALGLHPSSTRWGVSVERYPRHGRCVLRYTLPSHSGHQPAVAFGKVYPQRPGAGATVLAALDGKLDDEVSVPRLLGGVEGLHLVLLEALPGRPITLPSRAAIEAYARVAVSVHRHEPPANLRTLRSLGQSLRSDLADLADGPLADSIAIWAERATELGGGADPLPPRLAHGDLTPGQVMIDGERLCLLDFDDACAAEPASDLGRFCAYLRVAYHKRIASRRAAAEANAACGRFLERYMRLAEIPPNRQRDMIRRTSAYEGLALCRIALHSWQHIKWTRLRHTCSILEQRLL